ncbi:perlucin-like isoform X1 [Styela clava]
MGPTGEDSVSFYVTMKEERRENRYTRNVVIALGSLQIITMVIFFVVIMEIRINPDTKNTINNFTAKLANMDFKDAILSKKEIALIDTYDDISDIGEKVEALMRISGWYKAKNNRYYKLFPLKVNYFTAINKCRSFGAKLASAGIRNPKIRNEIIPKLVQPTGLDTWIGIDDLKMEGRWIWSDGVASNKNNTIWRPGQPDDARGKEECGHLDNGYQWAVNDNICTLLYFFLCEI